MSEASHGRETTLDARVRASCFRGSLHDFFEADTPEADTPTVVVGFNTGFGNTNRKLTHEWIPSLLEVRAIPHTPRSAPFTPLCAFCLPAHLTAPTQWREGRECDPRDGGSCAHVRVPGIRAARRYCKP